MIGDSSFWWVFAGRACFLLAFYMILQYLLYISTDYLHLPTAQAGQLVALCTVIFAIFAAIFIAISGPLSDRIKRRKPFISVASLILTAGAIPMIAVPSIVTLLIFIVLSGIAFGAYVAVDQALMVEALPSTENSARDLGILALATTLPGVFAPAAAGVVVTLVGYLGLFVVIGLMGLAGAACMFGVRRIR
jgi:MFS family permease